ncbi:MAG TPA: hypothetical protein PKC43_05830 [Phycisphaerales bacterium]|nr:hypothetical protein [Phycisphaerales bacterium]HMP36952.1 hypothetical protein [Phycisphaerales bacterium]
MDPQTPAPTAPAATTAESARGVPTGQDLLPSLLPALGVLAALAVVGTVTIAVVRRRMRSAADERNVPFTLDELRRLHREGKLTEDEFARARQSMLDAAKRAMARTSAASRDSRR